MRLPRFVVHLLALAFLLTLALVLGGLPGAAPPGTDLVHARNLDPPPLAVALLQCPDLYEPNDDFGSAWEISGGKIYSYICDETDVDYFRFAANAGDTVTVELFDLPLDYNLCLYDPGQVELACSEYAGTEPETVELVTSETGTHYAYVYGVGALFDEENPYTLMMAVTPPCTVVNSVVIDGPSTGTLGTPQTFTVTVGPPSVTLPITYTWETTAQSDVVQSGSFTQTVVSYTWGFTGTMTVAVEAANCGSRPTDTHTITIEEPPPLPDLVITDVWFDGWHVWYQARNVGQAAAIAPHEVVIYIDSVDQDGDGISVDLAPGERHNGYFTGDWSWNCSPPSDVILVCADAYEDLGESDETNNCREETWLCDTTPPEITGPAVLSDTDTVTITWQTDEAADSVVRYDTHGGTYTLVAQDAGLVTDHSITLSPLPPATLYQYLVESTDGAGNTAASAPGFFETPPEADTQPPTIHSATVTRWGGAAGIHTLAPLPPEVYTFSSLVSDNDDVEKVEFYLDGERLETDYQDSEGVYETYIVPPRIEDMTREEWFATHGMKVVAYDRSGLTASNLFNYQPDFEPMPVYLDVTFPYTDHTLYIDPGQTVLPPGTTVDFQVEASQLLWRYALRGDMGPTPWEQWTVGEVFTAVPAVEFWVDGTLKHTSVPSGTQDFWHDFTWDASGLGVGGHRFDVVAKASDGGSENAVRVIGIEQAEPRPEVTRSVSRVDNVFHVELAVENQGTATATLAVVRDYLSGFQPVESMAFNPLHYDAATRQCPVVFLLNNLALPPGESWIGEYDVVPILYPDSSTFAYGIGSADVEVEHSDGLIEPFTRPYASTVGGELFDEALLNAVGQADYLIVTKPQALYDHTPIKNHYFVHLLLGKMARLASLKRGVLGYLNSSSTKHELAALIAPSGPWAQWLHDDFSTPGEGYMLIVGEDNIVDSWEQTGFGRTWANGTQTDAVYLTDHPYSDTHDGSGAPDLVVGRIIHSDPFSRTLPILASINVHEAVPGWAFDRSRALLVSGNDIMTEIFVANVDNLADSLGADMDVVRKVHWSESFEIDRFQFTRHQHNGFAAGNVRGDDDGEIIIASVATNRIYVLDAHGSAPVYFSRDFEAGDGLAVGDVLGEGWERIIVGDASQDQICLYRSTGSDEQCFSFGDLQPFDGLAAGNVHSDPNEEIVVAQASRNQVQVLHIIDGECDQVVHWDQDFGYQDSLAVGNVFFPNNLDDIVIANIAAGEIQVARTNPAGVVATFSYPYELGYGLSAAEMDGDGLDEIVIGDAQKGSLQVYDFDNPSQTYREQKPVLVSFESQDGLATRGVSGQLVDEILIHGNDDYVHRTDGQAEDRMHSAFTAETPDTDVVVFMGHGLEDGWTRGLTSERFPLGLDFGNQKPVVYALACLTGNYAQSDSIAEEFIDGGAAVYIGATERSSTENVDADERLFELWDTSEHIGHAFLELEREKWHHSDWWQYWIWEYNLYGDPKYGAIPPAAALAAPTPAPAGTPTTTLQVTIPDYVVSTTPAGLDYVELPGGHLLLEDGQYRLPYWAVSIDYAPGHEVQDVILTDRSALTTATGLNLPLVSAEPWSSLAAAHTTSSAGGGQGWVPDDTYRWDLIENADGTSTLVVIIYPFYYWPETTDVEFYQDYTFDVDVISSTVGIEYLSAGEDAYPQGAEVQVGLWLANSGASQDIIVNGVIKQAVTDQVVGGLSLDALQTLSGTASFAASWDSTGAGAGYYYVDVEVRDTAGALLDHDRARFRLGIYAGEVTTFTATPTLFDIGDTIDLSLVFSNTGTVPLTATAVVRVLNATGDLLQESQHPIADLAPGTGVTVQDAWNTTGIEAGTYTLLGYVSYDGGATPPRTLDLHTRRQIYLPIITRD
jgi:hypothetical protein